MFICLSPCAVAAHAGLKSGDVIVTINGERVCSHRTAIRMIDEATKTKHTLEVEVYPATIMVKAIGKQPLRSLGNRMASYA